MQEKYHMRKLVDTYHKKNYKAMVIFTFRE